MRPRRVLLVEVLDAAGADSADVREHVELLRAAGAVTEAVIVSTQLDDADPEPERGRARLCTWHHLGRAGLDELRGTAERSGCDLALVASASPGGGKVARSLMPILPTRWWPTGVPASPRWGLGWGRSPAAPPVVDDAEAGREAPGLEWSTVDGERFARGRPTLWDGEYVLVPLAPSGGDAARVLAAFTEAASERSTLDLLVLAEPSPELERQARACGVGGRIHFAGAAPREAEWTWWRYAAAALLASSSPCSGGVLLRGMAVGCPLVIASDRREWSGAGDWLARHHCLPPAPGTRSSAGARLAQALERGPEVVEAVARGRHLAAAHQPARLAQRLAAGVGGLTATPAVVTPAAAA